MDASAERHDRGADTVDVAVALRLALSLGRVEHRVAMMKRSRQSSYPMPIEDAEELARELDEFRYRETTDPDEADLRRFYKVERWDAAEMHVEGLLTPATTYRKPGRSLPRGRRAGRVATTRCARAYACSIAGRLIADSGAPQPDNMPS